MSEKLERIPLSDEMTEVISGGEFLYLCLRDNGVNYIWSDTDPDNRYCFDYSNGIAINKFLRKQCAGKSDAEAIQLMLDANLIWHE